MANLPAKPRSNYVRRMFARIAQDYDTANRWMSWGQDARWRREVLHQASLLSGGKLLDAGTGTGDLALEALRADPSILAVGADFTPAMMLRGRSRAGGERVCWVNADALELPFPAQTFDAVVSGYLLRNVIDIKQALSEQYRVLVPGGRVVCLDTTPISSDLWHLPARIYVQHVIPLLGRIIAGDAEAYRYLPQSTARFLAPKELADRMSQVGFKDIHFQRRMGGTMAIHWAVK